MAIVVTSYISDRGELLFPTTSTEDNTSDLISDDGTMYFVQTQNTETPTIVAGNPIGLLLTLTYS